MTRAFDVQGSASPHSIAITGFGMSTSLGRDGISSCAAARAGITRTVEIDSFVSLDEESGELVPASVHRAAGVVPGFEGLGRIAQLGSTALRDLVEQSRLDAGILSEVPVFIALGGGFLWTQAHLQELLPHAASLAFDVEETVSQILEHRQSTHRQHLVSRIADASGIPLRDQAAHYVFGDDVGFVTALNQALEILRSGETEMCLVAAIDSLVDPRMMDVLSRLRLLKTQENPMGRMPGEGAVFLLLESKEHATARGSRVAAIVDGAFVRTGGASRFEEAPDFGSALAEAVQESARASLNEVDASPLFIGNLNGDPFRSRDWAAAVVGLPRVLRDGPLWVPAASFGDGGAAMGAIAACLGVRAHQRGYAPSNSIVVWLSGDDGQKGSFALLADNLQRGS